MGVQPPRELVTSGDGVTFLHHAATSQQLLNRTGDRMLCQGVAAPCPSQHSPICLQPAGEGQFVLKAQMDGWIKNGWVGMGGYTCG